MRGLSCVELLMCLAIIAIILSSRGLDLRALLSKDAARRSAIEIDESLKGLSLRSSISGKEISLLFDLEKSALYEVDAKGRKIALIYRSTGGAQITSARFASLEKRSQILSLYRSGCSSPGRFAISSGHQICEVIQSIRGSRRIECEIGDD